MKKVIWKPFFDYEKEEQWLNNMVRQGWALKKYTWCRYAFEPCEPGEYTYRLELLDDIACNPRSGDYFHFVNETGAEHISSYFRWAYFRKKTADGPFEIYTDLDSNIRHCQKIYVFWLFLAIGEIMIGLSNIGIGLSTTPVRGFHLYLSLPAGTLLFLLGFFFLHLAIKVHNKIRSLQKERTIRE